MSYFFLPNFLPPLSFYYHHLLILNSNFLLKLYFSLEHFFPISFYFFPILHSFLCFFSVCVLFSSQYISSYLKVFLYFSSQTHYYLNCFDWANHARFLIINKNSFVSGKYLFLYWKRQNYPSQVLFLQKFRIFRTKCI